MRYLVRERLFSIGDDSWVTDERGDKVFLVDGKALRLHETFELPGPYPRHRPGRLVRPSRVRRNAFDCGFGGYSTRNRSQRRGGRGGRACWLAAGDLVVGEGELAA